MDNDELVGLYEPAYQWLHSYLPFVIVKTLIPDLAAR